MPSDSKIRDPPLSLEINVIILITLVSFFFLKLTTDAPGLMEGNFFLSAIGFGLLPPAPKLYSEINLTVLFSTGMFLVGVSGVLSSLGLVISKDKIATPGGALSAPREVCRVSSGHMPRFPRKFPVFSVLFHKPMSTLMSSVHALSRITCNLLHKM